MVKHKENPFGPNIVYYCKDCEKIVNAQQVGRKFVFRCTICKTKNVAFGTDKSLRSFYHIEEEGSEKRVRKKVAKEEVKGEKEEVKK